MADDEFEDADSSSEALEDDDDLRASLSALSTLTTTTLPLPHMLTHVAEFAVRAIPGADGAGLTLFHDAKADTVVASETFVEQIDRIQYELGEGPCITAAEQSRTVRSGSLGDDSEWPRFGPRASGLGVHSVLSLPLLTGEGAIGSMNVYAHQLDAFDGRATELGELYATPAAISVQNARALSTATQLVQQLEQALTSRAIIDHAIGILISRSGSTPAEAFARLRVLSQSENTKLVTIAQSIVDEAARRARARHN